MAKTRKPVAVDEASITYVDQTYDEAVGSPIVPLTKLCRVCGAENPLNARECSECHYTFPDLE